MLSGTPLADELRHLFLKIQRVEGRLHGPKHPPPKGLRQAQAANRDNARRLRELEGRVAHIEARALEAEDALEEWRNVGPETVRQIQKALMGVTADMRSRVEDLERRLRIASAP